MNGLLRMLRVRLDGERLVPLFLVAWYSAALTIVIGAPVQLRFAQPFWNLGPDQLLQSLTIGAAFMIFALFLISATRQARGIGMVPVAATGVACFAIAGAILFRGTSLEVSRLVFLVATIIGVILAVLPYMLTRANPIVLALLVLGAAGVIGRGVQASSQISDHRMIATVLQDVELVYHRGLIPTPPALERGGAIAAYGDGFLLATGAGQFYRIDNGVASPVVERLDLPAPFDRTRFLDDHEGMNVPRLRLTGLVVSSAAQPPELIVAHQHWNSDERCFTIRVSAMPFPEDVPTKAAGWQSIFESSPCLSGASFVDIATGGRLVLAQDGRLLLSVGDHGFDGVTGPALPQQADNDYGKVLVLDRAGSREVLTLGHRNPQGLAVDQHGGVWLSEHGPRGGDEINHLLPGANYGWPFATYGVDYDLRYWPVGPNERHHGGFQEPAMAFVPSIGASALVVIAGDEFPEWTGDMLLASLAAQSLFRLRARDDRIVYAEPIAIGRRIRDLAEGSDGRIMLWTDEGDLVVVRRAGGGAGRAGSFARCAACHGADGTGTALGPSLRGVHLRSVGGRSDFPYSMALRNDGGVWTNERLDAFLRDPQAYMPGTTMVIEGIADAGERAALVEYLVRLN